MARYAAETEVSTERSRGEIERTLTRYGARRFAYMQDEDQAAIIFEASGRRIRFILPLPDRMSNEFIYTSHTPPRTRNVEAQHDAWEQACRQRWRALALAIKAKLEAVEAKIASFEEEFMAYVVLPSGQTVGEFLTPQIETAYATQAMPKMLPGIGETGPSN